MTKFLLDLVSFTADCVALHVHSAWQPAGERVTAVSQTRHNTLLLPLSHLDIDDLCSFSDFRDKIPCSEIRKRTKIIDIIEYTLKQKRKWAGHIARLKDNRWTKRCNRVAAKEREEVERTTKQKMAR